MGSKTQTSTSNQTSTPVNQAALQSIYGQVANAASTPFTPYSGELTAGINGQQTAGINTINQGANAAQPYYAQAGQLASSAANPLTSAEIQQFQNPYIQNVVSATQAQFNDQNGQQQNSLKGTAAQQGALGGDRQAVAQAQLAGQQQLAQAPTIANLYANSYNSGLQTAAQQYQQNPLAAASALGNIGAGTENAALAGGTAQLQAGTLQQQTQQAADTSAYGQYQAAQAYPYQSAAYLEQYGLPAALAQGTTSSGTQTTPGPSVLGQIAGLGIAGASLASKIPGAKDGGRINAFATGGSPGYINSPFGYIDSSAGYIPTGKGAVGSTTFNAPQLQYAKQQTADMQPVTQAVSGLKFSGSNPLAYGSSVPGAVGPTSVGGAPLNNTGSGIDPTSMESIYSRGGLVDAIHHIHRVIKRSRGGAVNGEMPFQAFDDGGNVSFADRFQPATENPFGDMSRGQAIKFLANQNDATLAPQSIPGGEPPPVAAPSPDAVVNPDSPYRMDPAADQSWRAGVDQPNPALIADAGMPDANGAPPNQMTRGLPPQITNPDNVPAAQPTSALAFDSTGRNPVSQNPTSIAPPQSAPDRPSGPFNPFHLSDNASTGLLAAGLGMLASRSPFAGVALGEGGLQGLAAYSNATKADQEAADKAVTQKQNQQRIDQEAERLHQSIKDSMRAAASAPLIAGPDGKMIPNQAELAYEKQKADINQKDKWAPVGTVVAADGSLHPLAMNAADHSTIDLVTQKPPLPSEKVQGLPGKKDPAVISHNVDGIISGHLPPTLTGLYGISADVRAGLEEKGFDLPKAQLEMKQAEKQVATLNGPQMTRFVGLAKSVDSTIDEVRNLSKEMDNSGIPKLNAAKLALYMQAEGNSQNGQLAARYIGAVNTLKEEFANLANGGYAPTEAAWELANKQINGDYGVKQLGSSLDEVQRLIRYRVQAIPGLNTMGPGASNRYTGQAAAPTGTPAAATPPTPASVPPAAQRVVGQVYPTPKGLAKWTGQGWQPQ